MSKNVKIIIIVAIAALVIGLLIYFYNKKKKATEAPAAKPPADSAKPNPVLVKRVADLKASGQMSVAVKPVGVSAAATA